MMSAMPERSRGPRVALDLDDPLAVAVHIAAEVFAARRWHYGGDGVATIHTPDASEIARKIASLIDRCAKVNTGGSARVSSGRFLVERHGAVSSVWLHLADVAPEACAGEWDDTLLSPN